jgi:hypothetical protein
MAARICWQSVIDDIAEYPGSRILPCMRKRGSTWGRGPRAAPGENRVMNMHRESSIVRSPIASAGLALFVPLSVLASAVASPPTNTFLVTVDPEQSDLALDLGLAFPFGGSLIGDYDADSNPGGTRTVPGVAGGGENANEAIPYSASLGGTSLASGSPSSTMQIVLGDGPFAWLRDLSFELVDLDTTGVELDIMLEFQTFRTFQPFSLFPGGFPISLSLPIVSIDSITWQQGPMTTGLVIPTGPGRRFLIAVLPGVVTLGGSALGEPFTVTSPLAAPIFGEMVFDGDGFTIAVSFGDSGQFSIPLPLPPFPPLPTDLPTPTGEQASILLTVQLQGIAGNALLEADFFGTGEPTFSIADLNDDTAVNGLDLNDLLSNWGGQGIGDINQDQIVNGLDLMLLMGQWTGPSK